MGHIYRRCRNAGALIDGAVVNTYGGSSGSGVTSNFSTFRYEDFTTAFDDADDTRVEIDGTIRSSTSRDARVCITVGSTSTVSVERFSRVSDRGALIVRSSEGSRTVSERIGPAPGPPGGPTCEPQIRLTEEARATISPAFAPDATLSVRFENIDGIEGGDARLGVRADDGSSVEVSGRLDGTRPDRVSWGGDGGVADVRVRGRFRPDLTALPDAR